MQPEEKDEIVLKLKTNNVFVLRQIAKVLQPEEIAELINAAPEMDVKRAFLLLDKEKAINTFEYLDLDIQYKLLTSFPVEQISEILNDLSPDDRTALFEHIPEEVLKNWLTLLSQEERKIANSLLRYPKDSIGRSMTTDYLSIRPDLTVGQALDYIRIHGEDSETLNVIYVTDNKGFLLDDLKIRELLLAPLDKKISELLDNQYISLSAKDDQEEAGKVFKKTDRYALPVTDFDGLLLGIVTVDDVLDIIEEEATEDVQKIGGTEAFDEPYFKISLGKIIRKRASWLVILFVGEMFTATAMAFFQNEIAKAVVLALFVPLIISSGGNSGSQAATIIIRSMALGEITLTDWWRVMKREIYSGLLLGIILGIIGFCRIFLWTFFTNVYGVHWMLVAFTVSFSLIGVVLWGTLSGSMLPIFLKKLGLDPAVSSAPFVATIVDVTGLIIYFSIAFVILHHTLLA